MASFSPTTPTERRSVEEQNYTTNCDQMSCRKHIQDKTEKEYLPLDKGSGLERASVIEMQVNAIALKFANLRSHIRKTTSDTAEQLHDYNEVAVKSLSVLCHLEREKFVAIFSDKEGKVLGQMWVDDGATGSVQISARDLFTRALGLRAYGLFVAHNHPSGNAEPSRRDIRDTRLMAKLARYLGIKLLDHIIIGRDRVVSMKKRGII